MDTWLRLPAGSGFPVWPHKIDNGNIVKAEGKCFIFSDRTDDGSTAVMKMYYQRGFANFIREKIMCFRAEREYRILSHLVCCGVPCSIPLNWTYGYCKEYGFYEILSTRQIPDTISLREFLSSTSIINNNLDWKPLFQMVHHMHSCGVYHGALSTKNILIDFKGNARPNYYILDLARGWLFPRSIFGKKIARFDLLKLVKNIENKMGTGFCRPYLSQYGLGKEALERFYREAGHHKSYSRKQKLIKNILKVRVFFSAISAKLNLRGPGVNYVSISTGNRLH